MKLSGSSEVLATVLKKDIQFLVLKSESQSVVFAAVASGRQQAALLSRVVVAVSDVLVAALPVSPPTDGNQQQGNQEEQ